MTRCSLAVLGLAVAVVGCAPKAEPASSIASRELPTVVVTVAPVQTRSIQRSVDAVGTLQGYEDTTLSPKVGGRVVATAVDLGDTVFPGQPILQIDPADYRKEADRANRALSLELARLALPGLIGKADFKPEDVPAVRKAQYALDNAELEYRRIAELGGASGREKDTAFSEVQLAKATLALALAEANAGLTTAWLRKDEVELAEMKLADCMLHVPFPSLALAYSSVLGIAGNPFQYTVARKLVAEGDLVQSMPKTDAYRLVMDRALKLPVAVPEKHIAEVRRGQLAEVRVDAYPDRVFPGYVARVSSVIDPANRTFYPVIAVMNLDRELKAGGFARVSILSRKESVLAVPSTAVVSFAGVDKVFVIENDRARAVEVKVGTRDTEWTEVAGDIPADAKVATSGFSQLVEGSPVKIRE